MPLVNILNQKEAHRFDQAPEFNGEERKKYFRLSMNVRNIISKFFTPHAQIGFLLHLGYFRATGRFYNAQEYRQADYTFVIKHLGYTPTEVKIDKYTKQMYARHKTIILQLCGVVAFKEQQVEYKKQLLVLIDKYLQPKNILLSMLDWLRVQKIEVPSYHTFATSITELLKLQEKKMANWLEKNLSEKQTSILDELMRKDEINKYQLTRFKYIEQSERPGKILQSVEVFNTINSYFQMLRPCIEALNLTVDTWRNYAHWAITARASQLQQFANPYH